MRVAGAVLGDAAAELDGPFGQAPAAVQPEMPCHLLRVCAERMKFKGNNMVTDESLLLMSTYQVSTKTC